MTAVTTNERWEGVAHLGALWRLSRFYPVSMFSFQRRAFFFLRNFQRRAGLLVVVLLYHDWGKVIPSVLSAAAISDRCRSICVWASCCGSK